MDRSSTAARLAFLALLVPYLLLVRAYWFLCDDAFITWRFSRNWALGHGPRYNLGPEPPVEGYSDFLWMAAGALVHRVGADVMTVMPLVSAACGVGALALMWRVLRVHAAVPLPLAWLACAAVAVMPPFAVWSTSGLETMPHALLLLATWALLAVEPDDRRAPLAAGVTGLLLALIRTEGVAWAALVGGVAVLQRALSGRPILAPLARFAAPVIAGYGAYFAWRYGYYQSLLANTAHAKVHLTPETFARGLSYVGLFLTTLVTPALLAVSLPLSLRHPRRALALGAGLLALAPLGYAAAVSGDYMAWFRLLVPALPFLGISFGLAAAVLDGGGARRAPVALGLAGVVALGALPAADVHLVPASVRASLDVREKRARFLDENQQWASMARNSEDWREKGEALAEHTRPGDSYVAAAIGAVGYWSDLYIYDRNGLVTREVALRPWDGRLRSPGHDKTVPWTFFLDREPTILDAKVIPGPRLKPRIAQALRQMRAARVRHAYYPEIVELAPRNRRPRVLVMLRRADDPAHAEQGWVAYRERFERRSRR